MVAAGTIVFARRGGPPDLRISARVGGTPTPTPERPGAAPSGAPEAGFEASGSWTMSSLPSCFFEQDHLGGPLGDLRAKFPPETARIAPGSALRAGNCTVRVLAHELWISRGSDRLRVPPDARLYRRGDRLTLVSIDGRHAEIRQYCRGFDAVRCPTQSFRDHSWKRR